MAENNNETTGQVDQTDNAGESNERSEKRFRDLSGKVETLSREKEELTKQHNEEKVQLLKEKQALEFKAGLAELSSKYPNAGEFRDDIQKKFSSGYALEDAIVSTLASKGKLPTAVPSRTEVAGGSADVTVTVQSKDDPSFGGNREKMREELVRLEKAGEVQLK